MEPIPGRQYKDTLLKILQDTTDNYGLFKPSPNPFIPDGYAQAMKSINKGSLPSMPQVDVPNLPNYSQYQENVANKQMPIRLSSERQHEIAMEGFGYKPKKEIDPALIGYGMAGLSAAAGLIQGKKDKKPVVRPLNTYNPNAYGTGSQAIMKHGGKLKAYAGYTGGGEDPGKGAPKKAFTTQAEVDAANKFAQEFMKRKFPDSNSASNPLDMYVAKKPGDPIPQFVDTKGNPWVDLSAPRKKAYNVPHYINLEDIQGDSQYGYFYYDRDGKMVDVDSSVFSLNRFRSQNKPLGEIAKLKNGGKMKGKKCDNGALLPGKSYDLDPAAIQSLLNSGYELDFE